MNFLVSGVTLLSVLAFIMVWELLAGNGHEIAPGWVYPIILAGVIASGIGLWRT